MDEAGVLRLACGASDLLRLPLELVGDVLGSLVQARPTGAATSTVPTGRHALEY
jgi:hypothetical protein